MGKAYLILEDGHIFEGQGFGADGEVIGELVFTTGMTGYIETLSDPCCFGHIVMHTFPQIGNYGMNSQDLLSPRCHARGVVLRQWCEAPSNFRCEETVDSYLKRQGVVGISGLDTREITHILRERGVMNAMITQNPSGGLVNSLKNYKITGAVAATSLKERQTLLPEGAIRQKVALIDYGGGQRAARELTARGSQVILFPHDSPAEEILAEDPSGILLSDGPGDPAENTGCIRQIEKLLGKRPMFAIGLGHQLLALAAGGKTARLRQDHRGANQPVRELSTGRIYITSQNHGYTVERDSLDGLGCVLCYENVNDGSCEGLDYPHLAAFSMQFHPGPQSGAREMAFSFDKFIRATGGIS